MIIEKCFKKYSQIVEKALKKYCNKKDMANWKKDKKEIQKVIKEIKIGKRTFLGL